MSLRFHTSTAIGVMLSLAMPAFSTAFAEGSMTLHMVPHCTEQSGCPEFEVSDAEHTTTGRLAAGDILDIDVLVRGSDHSGVRSVRSWIAYDSKVLEARSVELTEALPSPTPGEKNIDTALGLVKIGGGTAIGFETPNTRIARITFRVLETVSDTELTFDGYNPQGTGHTAVNAGRGLSDLDEGSLPSPPCIDSILGCRGSTTPLLSGEPAKLTVKLTDGPQRGIQTAEAAAMSSSAEVSPSVSSAPRFSDTRMQAASSISSSPGMASSSSSPSSLTGQGSTFGILQVQDVRVTTKDDVIFLGWQGLRSSELAGYNVYYGTVSGRYIQRRSLPSTSTSLVLRDLQQGTTYYLAVRAVNKQDQESVFSQEVSVTVGKPETATSPMTNLPTDSGATGGNPVTKHDGKTVTGETGSHSVFLWIILGSAVIGTAFACRRQLVLTSHDS